VQASYNTEASYLAAQTAAMRKGAEGLVGWTSRRQIRWRWNGRRVRAPAFIASSTNPVKAVEADQGENENAEEIHISDEVI
jgi:hypothetical protein